MLTFDPTQAAHSGLPCGICCHWQYQPYYSAPMMVNVPEVERRIDRLEWLEINVYLSFLPFRGDDFPAVYNKSIGRHFGPQFEPLLSGRDR